MEEGQLVELIKEEDEHAFAILVDQYKPVVERFAFQFGVLPEYIPDIVQETFIKVYRKIDQYHTGKLSTWIYRITLNVARDHFRKQKRDQKLITKAKNSKKINQNDPYFFEKEEHVLLHECLQALDIKYRTPLILFYFHDKSYEDIASILKVKTSVVKTRLHRSKKLVKKSYEKFEREEVFLHE